LGGREAADVDVPSLARSTTGYSGADLFNMVNTAAIEATKRNLKKITMRIIESAKESVVMGPERKSLIMTAETKKLTAYHEAGHALVSLHTKGTNPIVKATLMPRGDALGFVSYSPKDELLQTKETMLAFLDTCMGGRVSEELIFGPELATQGDLSRI
jgi:ATP-dependent metalloprotease